MGAFVVFEGGDGSGKTTQARLLARGLAREGYDVDHTHEPGGTPFGEASRRWLRSRSSLSPMAELLLFVAARAQHVEEIIAPALRAQQTVVCDRFTSSTVAYQGYGRGLDQELIGRLNELATIGLRPDLSVLLDMPAEIALARRKGRRLDTFESETAEFHRRVREGFLALASGEPDRWLVLDGTMPRKVLELRIMDRVRDLLSGTV